MHRFTRCLVFLVISATPNSASEDSWVSSSPLTHNKETKPLLKEWVFHMAVEDLIEFKTDAEDLMRVAHLPATPDFPHPSIGALLDKSHATYPVQHHCAAPQHGGEMRLMLQLVPKDLICREINTAPLEPEIGSQLQPDLSMAQSVPEKVNLDDTTGEGTEEIETTGTTSNTDEANDALVSLVEVEEVAEEDLDEGSGIMYSPLVTLDIGSSAVEPQAPKVILKEAPTSIANISIANISIEVPTSIANISIEAPTSIANLSIEAPTSVANISIDGLPESKFPTEKLLRMSTVEAGSNDTKTLIAALFPSSLWMFTVDTSDEERHYSYVDHLDVQIEDQNAQAVSMNFLPIYVTMDDNPSLDEKVEMEDGSWENFVLIHKKILPAKLSEPTVSPVSQLMEADLALLRVGENGTLYPFYYSFQGELPWSPVQASLSFTRDKSSIVVYATKDTITGFQINQSPHSNKLLQAENMDSIAVTDSVVDMALAQINSKFFLVVLEKIDDNNSTVKVFPFVKKSKLYDFDSNSVFEMKMPDMKFFKMKSFYANSTNYVIFAGSYSNAALYSIENNGKLIHRQDFSLDEIIDVHLVKLNASSNEDLLIFIQNTGAVVYFLESPHTWKFGRQVFFDNVLESKSDSNSIVAISNSEGGLTFVIYNSTGSLLEMNLNVGSDLTKLEDDGIQAETDEHALEDTKEGSVEANTYPSTLEDTEEGSVEAETDQSVIEDTKAKTDENGLEDTTVLEELDDSLQTVEVVNNFTSIENEVDEVTNENDLEELTNIVQPVELMDNSTNKDEDFDQYSQNEDTTINSIDSTTTVMNEMNVENLPEALHLTIKLSQNEDNEAENTLRSTSVNSVEPLNDFNNDREEKTEVTSSNAVKNVQNEQRTTEQPNDLKLLETKEKNVLVELIRILKFYIYLSKDDSAEVVNGLKPLIGLLKDVKDHEALKQPDYASSIVNVIADLENTQDNEKVTWDAKNVKKLELVLNIVADIVNEVERPPMTEDLVIQLLEEIKASDQFSNDTEAIEYVVQSLKERGELNVSKVESNQTDVILLKINFILKGRDVKSLNQNDLINILQELKPLTKYKGQELEMVKQLVNELSYLKEQQKDWINEKLTKVNKNGLVDVNSLREVVSKMEEDLKNYEEIVSVRKEDLLPGNSTVNDIINSDDEDAANMVNMLNSYVEELKVLDTRVTEETKIEAYTENAFNAEALIAYNSTAEEAINSDDDEADEDVSDMIQLLTGYVEDLKSREAQDLSATTAINLNDDDLEIKSSTETVFNSEYEEDRVNGLISDEMDSVVPPDSKFSEEADWCSRGNNCHPMASCENGEKNYTCLCKKGFQGNGTHCEDMNVEMVPASSTGEHLAASGDTVTTTSPTGEHLAASGDTVTTTSPTGEHLAASGDIVTTTSSTGEHLAASGDTGTTTSPTGEHLAVSGDTVTTTSPTGEHLAVSGDIVTTTSPTGEHLAASSEEAQVVVPKEEQEAVPQKQVELSNLLQLIKRFRNYIEEKELKLNPETNGQQPTEIDEVSAVTEEEHTENEFVLIGTDQEPTIIKEESVGTEQEGSRDERKLEALTIELEEVLAEHEETLTQLEKDSTRHEHEPTDQGKEETKSLSQSEKLQLLTELINELRIYADKIEREASKMENKDISTGNDGTSTSTQSENITEEGSGQFKDKSTQSEYTTEGSAQFEDTSTQSEDTAEEANGVLTKEEEVRAFFELIKKFRIYIEKIESKAKSAKNDTSSGLWPLIEHLRKLSTLQEVNKSLNMSKEVDDLLEQLKQADQHFANASWDAKKLDMILDRERELIENKTSETVIIEKDNKADKPLELVNGMQSQEDANPEVQSLVTDTNEDEGDSSGTMSDGEEDGELKWLIEGLRSSELNSSIVSKVKKADQGKTSDLELLKEILRDLEQEKEIYESRSMGTSNENLPESRSLTDSSGRGTIEDESVVDDEDMEAMIESHVEELESQVEELKFVVEKALDEDDRKTSTDKNEEEIPDSKEAEGSDWCSRNSANCHPNAECRNGASNYTCHCKNGFEGNGTHCRPAGDFDKTSQPEENTNTTEANIEESTNTTEANIEENTNTTEANIEENTNTTESNIEGVSVNPSKLATNDTASKETASLELKELIFDWREKFFIILAFFILFAVLFLIIIAVLIYKMKQSGEYTPIDAPNVSPSD